MKIVKPYATLLHRNTETALPFMLFACGRQRPECDDCHAAAKHRCITCGRKLCKKHAYLVDVNKYKCKKDYVENPYR